MPDLSAQLDSLLYIDVCCADASDAVSIGHEAINWLRKRCSVDIDGQPLPFSLHQVFDSGLPDSILSIEVNETSTQSEEHILLKDTSIEARVYHLLENKSQLDDTNDLPHSIVTSLPYTGYQRFWDRLVFNPPMQLKLLNALARLVMLSQHPRDETNTATSVETR